MAKRTSGSKRFSLAISAARIASAAATGGTTAASGVKNEVGTLSAKVSYQKVNLKIDGLMKKLLTSIFCFALLITLFSNHVVQAQDDPFWVKQIQAKSDGLYLLRANGDLLLIESDGTGGYAYQKIAGDIARFNAAFDEVIAIKTDGSVLFDKNYLGYEVQNTIGPTYEIQGNGFIAAINVNGELWGYSVDKWNYFDGNASSHKFADDVKQYLFMGNISDDGKTPYILKSNGELWYGDKLIAGYVDKIHRRGRDNFYVLKQGNLLVLNSKDNSLVKSVNIGYITDIATSNLEDSFRTVMAINNNGELYAWGFNSYAQIGNDSNKDVENPVKVLDKVKLVSTSLSSGSNSTFAVRENGEIWAWGSINKSKTPQKMINSLGSGINTPTGQYKNAASWAIPELTEAEAKGLLEPVMSLDFRKNITREQFCQVVVRYYEILIGGSIPQNIINPFTDTKNVDVLKAYSLGIVKGTSNTTFSPKAFITREEIAVMLKRALDKAKPNYDYQYQYKRMEDESAVSTWALDAVKKLRSMEVTKGDANNNFNPRAYTTVEQACLMAYRLLDITD